MRFSIITPVWLSESERERRVPLFTECIDSVKRQDYDHDLFEHIIVNDGSSIEYEIPTYPWIRVLNQQNLQRLTAYNTGLKTAQGDIIMFLDSDDAYEPNYLRMVYKLFRHYPQYKLLNFGCKYNHLDGTVSTKEAFKPAEKEEGHEVFGSGGIVNGTYVFKREVYEKLGGFPEGIKTIDVPWYKKTELFWTSPYDFSAYAQSEFPEIQPYFQVTHPDHPSGLPKELGNPWGQDYYLFYKYTRKYHSKPIDEYPLIVNTKP